MKFSYFHFYTLVSYWLFVSSQTLEFTQQPDAVYYAYTGIPLVIQCRSAGTLITYRRNNAPVGTTSTNEAHTQNSPVEDVDGSAAGIYWDCQTSNDDGGEILSSRAIVYWATFVDSSTAGQVSVTLRASVNSYLPCDFFAGSLPTPVIGWELNGNPIVDPKILPGSNSLLLESFDAVNGQVYRCFLENRYGDPNDRIQANRDYILNVVDENTFSLASLVYPSADITNTVGDEIHFECVAYAASCYWQYLIEGTWVTIPVDSLHFPANLQSVTVTVDSPTSYRAIVEGDIQNTRTLTIYQLPEVISSIQGELIEYERQTISIDCQTSGVPEPTVDLYKDSVLIQNSGKYTLSTSGNTTTLQVADLEDSDTGYYTCRADNSEASAVANGRITVRVAVPPSFSQHPTPDFIEEVDHVFDNFSISCSATGDPLPQIEWQFTSPTEDLIITESVKHTIVDSTDVDNSSRTSVLTVSSVTARDNGDYTCISENFKGINESQVSTVRIPSDPVIESPFPSNVVKILEKETYYQDCEAYAEPHPVVTWSTASGAILANTSVFTVFPNNTLAVVGNRQQSGRVYTCTATSAGTEIANSFTLIVNSCAIVEVTPSGPLNSIDHVNTTISCSSEGEPVPTSEWVYMRIGSSESGTLPSTLNGVLVVNDFTFSIQTISSENEGSYCCQVYTDELNETCGIQSVCVTVEYVKDCDGLHFCIFELWQLIVIIVAAIVLIILVLGGSFCLIYLIIHHYQSRTYNIKRAGEFSLSYTKEKREDDSDDDGEFDPTYESLPANKSVHPPIYKQAPYYGGGADSGLPSYNPPPQAGGDTTSLPLDGLLLQAPMAYPPPVDIHHASMPMLPGNFAQGPEMYPHEYMHYPGEMMKPQPDEFLSTDGQFV